jgi:hypothetical protein
MAALLPSWALPSTADSTQARCEIYPKGSDKLETMVPCTFSQRQGYITITREDGVTYDLSPVGDTPGNFRDQDGHAVYRQSGLGEAGLIFRFPKESLFVYWDNAASEPAADNATAPFATKYAGGDYDATTLLRCKADGGAELWIANIAVSDRAAFRVLRFSDGEFTDRDGDAVQVSKDGDTWSISVGQEHYRFADAVIAGG